MLGKPAVTITKRFAIKKEIDVKSIRTLPEIITLCMFKDAILSAVRWHKLVKDSEAVEGFCDRTFSIAAGAGWAFEAIKFLRDLYDDGVITDELLRKMPQSEPIDPKSIWDECIESENDITKRIKKIRNSAFAHFYDRNEKKTSKRFRLASKAIAALANKELESPFVEWTETNSEKHNLNSSNTFAMMAICHLLFGIENGKTPNPPPAIGDQVLKIGILLENVIALLIDKLMNNSEIAFEPYSEGTQ